MPRMQMYLSDLNAAFAKDGVGALEPDTFAFERGDLIDALGSITELRPELENHLRDWPSGLLAAVQGILHENLVRAARNETEPLPVTFAWAPDYDFTVQFWDVGDTSYSYGGITVLFKGRFPHDTGSGGRYEPPPDQAS